MSNEVLVCDACGAHVPPALVVMWPPALTEADIRSLAVFVEDINRQRVELGQDPLPVTPEPDRPQTAYHEVMRYSGGTPGRYGSGHLGYEQCGPLRPWGEQDEELARLENLVGTKLV